MMIDFDLIIVFLGWAAAVPVICILLYWQRHKILQLRKAYAELQTNKSLLRLMLESAAIGTAIVAPNGQWMRVNPAICKLFGYSQEELLEKDFQSVTHSEDLPLGLQNLERMMKGELKYLEFEKRYIHKDGSPVWTHVYAAPVWGTDGTLKYIVSQMVDISARKQSEKEGEQLVVELTRANNELERFAFIASHDLQEPLRTICSFAELIEHECGTAIGDNGRKYLGIITDAGRRMHDLVRDLLDYAHAGQGEEQGTIFETADALEQVQKNLLQKIMATGTTISSSDLPRLLANETHFRTLMQNLIENAIKYQQPRNRPAIVITGKIIGNNWQFSIQDNGIGLNPEYSRQIFEPFKRLHRDDQYQGTGMGLAICRKIVESAGGEIWVESALGNGSTFHFTLPRIKGI